MTLPTSWNDAAVLDGLDIEDKSKLVGLPFLITGCEFKMNRDNVSIAYIDAEWPDGQGFTFTDSSTGVRAQLVAYLASLNMDHVVDTGEYAKVRLVSPNGLRVSEYEITRPVPGGSQRRGEKVLAKTYYLTTSGRRAGREQAQENGSKTRKVTRPATQN